MWAGVSPSPGADVAAASPSAAADVAGGEPRVRTSSTACASFGRFCRTFARASGWAKYLKKGAQRGAVTERPTLGREGRAERKRVCVLPQGAVCVGLRLSTSEASAEAGGGP